MLKYNTNRKVNHVPAGMFPPSFKGFDQGDWENYAGACELPGKLEPLICSTLKLKHAGITEQVDVVVAGNYDDRSKVCVSFELAGTGHQGEGISKALDPDPKGVGMIAVCRADITMQQAAELAALLAGMGMQAVSVDLLLAMGFKIY